MYNLVATKAATFSLSPRPFWYGFVQETFMLISRLIPKTVGRMESRGEIKHDRWEGGGGGWQSPQVIFVFLFILGMLMYANEIETGKIKNYLR